MTQKKTIIIILCLVIAAILLAYLVFSTIISTPTTLYVDPSTTKSAVGQDFIINISISSVSDLYGCTFSLNWTATIINAVNVTEGPFLESGARATYFYNSSTTAGHVTVICTLLRNVSGVNGSGVLATIRFHVLESGECDLYLYGATLLNSSIPPKTITTAVKSGKFST